MDREALRAWVEVLDSLSYYDLFRIDPRASHEEMRQGFLDFAAVFHPDVHLARSPDEREAIHHIFKRGNEAYRVLSHPTLRGRYDHALTQGEVRPARLTSMIPSPIERAAVAMPLEDQVHLPSARPFARRAEELAKTGDLQQARLQLTLALHREPDNPALDTYLKRLDEQIGARKQQRFTRPP